MKEKAEKAEKVESLTKSKARVKELGEVFTPAALVSEMLDKLPPDCWLPEKTFLEPSCGTGNFLIQTLQRKLDAAHPPLVALSTISLHIINCELFLQNWLIVVQSELHY